MANHLMAAGRPSAGIEASFAAFRPPWQPATFFSPGLSKTGELFDHDDNILISCRVEKPVARRWPTLGTDDALALSNDTGLCLTRRIKQTVTFSHSHRVERM